jgi:hypothetical protein
MATKSLYLANENGDWWEFNSGSVLYVMRASDIPADVASDRAIDIRDGQVFDAPDKFEKTIWEFGTLIEELHADFINILEGDTPA